MFNTEDRESAWLRSGLAVSASEGSDTHARPGVTVASVLPETFRRYVKVLHPYELNYSYFDNPLTPPEEQLLRFEDCSVLRHFLAQKRLLGSTDASWHEMADLLQVPLAPEFSWQWCAGRLPQGCWPRYINGPADGAPGPQVGSALIEILRRHGSSDSIVCRLAEMSVLWTDTPLVHFLSLQGVLDLMCQPEYRDLPEYWWPTDRSWCVCSDYDLTFTLVGCDDVLCRHLLECKSLECIEVQSFTRIDEGVPFPGSNDGRRD